MRKRRIFDLDLPDAPETDPVAGQTPQRRGPMAAAISETGAALSDRAAILTAIREENDALAEQHVAARAAGLLAEEIPLDRIDTLKLIRDRKRKLFDDGSLAEMTASLRAVGLSNPIRVEAAPDGRYELIQGYRRLCAYRALLEETGDSDRWGAIPALISPPEADIQTLYRRMVDENLVRQDISFYEMAQLAMTYARDAPEEIAPEKAVAVLFKSASYQKRSYIRAVMPVVTHLDRLLRYPEEIPRALALKLAARLEADDSVATAIGSALKDWESRSVADELEVLRRHAEPPEDRPRDPAPRPAAPAPARAARSGPAPAALRFDHDRHGTVVCSLGKNRLELQLGTDPTRMAPDRLESALRAFLDRID